MEMKVQTKRRLMAIFLALTMMLSSMFALGIGATALAVNDGDDDVGVPVYDDTDSPAFVGSESDTGSFVFFVVALDDLGNDDCELDFCDCLDTLDNDADNSANSDEVFDDSISDFEDLLAIAAVAAGTDITADFVDPIFAQAVRQVIGIGDNDPIYLEDVLGITDLQLYNRGISNLSGIRNFTELLILNVLENNLTSLDVSNNTKLIALDVGYNMLTSLDVSKNTALVLLWVDGNQLTSLDVSNNTALESLWVFINQLTTLDVSNNTNLIDLNASYNQLTSIDVSNNTALESLVLRDNQLTTLDISKNTALISLDVAYNQLTTLDVSNNVDLMYLYVDNNRMASIASIIGLANTSVDTADPDAFVFYPQIQMPQVGGASNVPQTGITGQMILPMLLIALGLILVVGAETFRRSKKNAEQ